MTVDQASSVVVARLARPPSEEESTPVPGSQELLVIALVALFVLGPERLPGLARSAARGLTKLRNYGVTASKELRGVAGLGEIEREVSDLRRELERTRADLRRAMRDTIASSPPSSRSLAGLESVEAAGEDALEAAGEPMTEASPADHGSNDGGSDVGNGDGGGDGGGDAPSGRGV
jgi:sec-independent protein translocase protein TatB